MSENYIDMEYRELNNHIRESWKYISDLLRYFLTFQILLVSLVFLSGNIIRIEGVEVSRIPIHDAAKNEQTNTTNKPSEDQNSKVPRRMAILVLVAIGAIGAAGAALQNYRLFFNATCFIRRGAVLESTKWFFKDTREPLTERTLPANLYMSDRIYPGKHFNLGWVLTTVYTLVAVMWCITFYWRFNFPT